MRKKILDKPSQVRTLFYSAIKQKRLVLYLYKNQSKQCNEIQTFVIVQSKSSSWLWKRKHGSPGSNVQEKKVPTKNHEKLVIILCLCTLLCVLFTEICTHYKLLLFLYLFGSPSPCKVDFCQYTAWSHKRWI